MGGNREKTEPASQKLTSLTLTQAKPTMADVAKSVLVLTACTVGGFILVFLGYREANVMTIYMLGVLISSIFASGWVHGLVYSALSVLLYNFFFTVPRFSFDFYETGGPITFIVMFVVALIAGTLVDAVKKQIKQTATAQMQMEQEQLRTNLLRTISHDLRTPLTSISGNAGVLLDNPDTLSDEQKHAMHQHIYDDSTWLKDSVENLLSLARVEDQMVQLHMQGELIEEVFSEALKRFDRDNSNHYITPTVSDDLLMAQMDCRLIVHVLINLVGNAIKYTPPGSSIIISAKRDGESVLVEVLDDGSGISDNAKQSIFDMFYTVNENRADSCRGLGLGLYLCRAIVEAHGGEMHVRDNSPKGAVFGFTLKAEEVVIGE